MLRPFKLRDALLIRRLQRHRIPLNAQAALTRSPRLLPSSLIHFFWGNALQTYVWRSERRIGYVRLQREEEDDTVAKLTGIASLDKGRKRPTPVNESAWLAMLDELMVYAGRQGIQSIVAEVREDGPELPVLRRAGFAVFTRQDVWVLNDAPNVWLSADRSVNLQRPHAPDAWDIDKLYTHSVPNMILLVEPHAPTSQYSWLVRESAHEVGAYVALLPGRQANWLQLWVHPNAAVDPAKMMSAVLRQRYPRRGKLLYCCIRRYQSWLQTPLRQNGFEYWGSQAVMVRHIVKHARKPVRSLEHLLDVESQTSTVTTPPIAGRWQHNGHALTEQRHSGVVERFSETDRH